MTNAIDRLRKVLVSEQKAQSRTFEQLPDKSLLTSMGEMSVHNAVTKKLDYDSSRRAAMRFFNHNKIVADNVPQHLKENRLRLIAMFMRYVDTLNKGKPDGWEDRRSKDYRARTINQGVRGSVDACAPHVSSSSALNKRMA